MKSNELENENKHAIIPNVWPSKEIQNFIASLNVTKWSFITEIGWFLTGNIGYWFCIGYFSKNFLFSIILDAAEQTMYKKVDYEIKIC